MSVRSDNWSLSIIRRSFALSPIVLCCMNTLSTIENGAYNFSIISNYKNNLIETSIMSVNTYDDEYNEVSSWLCDCDTTFGHPVNPHAVVTCPVTLTNYPPFAVFWSIWLGYFIILFCYHFYYCMQYSVTDLRYFICLSNASNNRYHKAYILFGIALTFCTCIYGIHTAYSNPVTASSSNTIIIVLFLVFNCGVLKQFLIVGFESMSPVNMEEQFPVVIDISHLPEDRHCTLFNLYGRVVSVDSLFRYLTRLLASSELYGSTYGLQGSSAGDIVKALSVLYANRVIDRDADVEAHDKSLETHLLSNIVNEDTK